MTIDTTDHDNLRLRALPVRILHTDRGVIVKRSRTELLVSGSGAGQVVQRLLEAAADGMTRDDLSRLFPAADRAAVLELLDRLIERRLVVREDDSATDRAGEEEIDVFYWQVGQRREDVARELDKVSFVILGVNAISRQLAVALRAAGATSVDVVAYPLLCNVRMVDDDGGPLDDHWPSDVAVTEYADWQERAASTDCLVVTSDFGGMDLIRSWNEYAVRNSIHLLPVVLQDLVGYVGPLVIPGETACYECLRARENSNLEDPATQRAMEPYAAETQLVTGFHPSMASILGDMAALELGRFYGRWAPPRVIGTLIEVNLLGPQLLTHAVLKVPRCPVCATLATTAAVNIRRGIFLPTNEMA